MTKTEMINIIEKSGMIVNFSRNYFMSLSKSKVQNFYNMALGYMSANLKED